MCEYTGAAATPPIATAQCVQLTVCDWMEPAAFGINCRIWLFDCGHNSLPQGPRYQCRTAMRQVWGADSTAGYSYSHMAHRMDITSCQKLICLQQLLFNSVTLLIQSKYSSARSYAWLSRAFGQHFYWQANAITATKLQALHLAATALALALTLHLPLAHAVLSKLLALFCCVWKKIRFSFFVAKKRARTANCKALLLAVFSYCYWYCFLFL